MESSEDLTSLDKDWRLARAVWSTIDIELPETPNERYRSHVDALRQAHVSYRAMKVSLTAARAVSVDLSELADRCGELCDDLTGLDPLSSSRLAGATRQSLHNLLTDALSTLTQLEMGLRTANVPTLPNKKPNEHLNFLVERLADLFEQYSHKPPTIYSNRVNNERVGKIVGFVKAFNKHFLDGEITNMNPRAIQRVLQARKKNPPLQL
jgi:hypothetical protein